MSIISEDIISKLKKDILHLQGFKRRSGVAAPDVFPAIISNAFPNGEFPLGAVHEFLYTGAEESVATSGFISGILASLMRNGGACIWISSSKTIFPPALASFGIAPEKIIFIDLKSEKEIIWAMEEALRCDGLAGVIGEVQQLSFTTSRRLQLAVEHSQVTGFILRKNPANLNITACVSRWKITSLPSFLADDMPGLGFPRWNVELVKIRNGKPGSWQIEFAAERFRYLSNITAILIEKQKKAG